MAALPYVTADGAAKSRDLSRGGYLQASVAALWLVAASVTSARLGLISPQRALALGGVLALVTLLSAWRYWRRVGGITGDFLGATEQLGEIAALAVLAWH
jgi:adenosylcobinamide-GDP ribazoletransferase